MLGFYFSPYGRICRKDFWLKFVLVLVGLIIASEVIDAFVFPTVLVSRDTGPAAGLVNLLTLWPQIALTTKRFHDRNMSGWWQLLFNVAIGLGGYFAYSALLEAQAAGGFDVSMPLIIGCALVFLFGLTELVILGFLPGTPGKNRFGDDPLAPENVSEVFA